MGAPSGERVARAARYFDRPDRYLTRNYRITRRVELITELLAGRAPRSILDLGGGDGAILSAVLTANAHGVLVDSSAGMTEAAAQQNYAGTVSIIHADALAYQGDVVDTVFSLGLLAHVPDTNALFAAVARNLISGGFAIVQYSPAERMLNRLGAAMFDMKRLVARGLCYRPTSTDEVIEVAGAYGLHLVDVRDHLLFLPGMPRLLGRALLPFDRAVSARPELAKHGLDRLALFKKA